MVCVRIILKNKQTCAQPFTLIPLTDKKKTDKQHQQKNKYPHLAKLGRAYLCAPAMFVPSERVSSMAGLVPKSSLLYPDHV